MEGTVPTLETMLLTAVVTGTTGVGGSSLGGGGAATSHCAGGSGGNSAGFVLGPFGRKGPVIEAFP